MADKAAELIIFGCGDIGRRVAKLYLKEGLTVTGVVRTAASAEALVADGISAHVADLDARHLCLPDCSEKGVFYMVPPPRRGDQDSRTKSLISCLGTSRPGKLVLISTTGVYGDCGGEWVNEARRVAPMTGRARRRLDAEIQWSDWAGKRDIPLTILRVPGIYSRARIPRERLQSGEPIADPRECGWTNRIHAEDLARTCVAAMARAEGTSVFNVSDGVPGTLSGYLIAAAQELGLPPPPIVSLAEARERLSPGLLSYLAESRRIDNGRMMRELGIRLLHPNLEQGLQH